MATRSGGSRSSRSSGSRSGAKRGGASRRTGSTQRSATTARTDKGIAPSQADRSAHLEQTPPSATGAARTAGSGTSLRSLLRSTAATLAAFSTALSLRSRARGSRADVLVLDRYRLDSAMKLQYAFPRVSATRMAGSIVISFNALQLIGVMLGGALAGATGAAVFLAAGQGLALTTLVAAAMHHAGERPASASVALAGRPRGPA